MIPIFCASDEKYAPFLTTTIFSILDNTSSYIDFYVLDGGISDKTKKMIELSLAKFDNYSIKYFDMSKYMLDRFPNVKHYSLNTFSGYFISDMVPDLEKVLYLDVDIIVKKDIKELFEIDLENKSIAAVPEDFYCKNGEYVKENILDSFSNTKQYFNAGVMLINIKKIVQNNYSKQFVDLTIKYFDVLSCPDQDIYNILFEFDNKIIDYKFNYMPDFYEAYNKLENGLGKTLEKNAIIFHYTCGKPWNDKNVRHSKDFWQILEQTPFYPIIKTQYNIQQKIKAYLFGFIKLPKSDKWSILKDKKFKTKWIKNTETRKGRNIISIFGIPVLKLKYRG